jgi:hypothetical protein
LAPYTTLLDKLAVAAAAPDVLAAVAAARLEVVAAPGDIAKNFSRRRRLARLSL